MDVLNLVFNKKKFIFDLLESAANEIINVYKSDFSFTDKSTNNLLTQADLISNGIITSTLKKSFPNILVVSEEDDIPSYKKRSSYDYIWLLDPLDGTAEFVNKNDEFTINLALISKGSPVAGFVYVPVSNILYYAFKDGGAYSKKNGVISRIHSNMHSSNTIKVAVSRSHRDMKKINIILNKVFPINNLEVISVGSTLKIVLVADGTIDLYPRIGPTWEWDTAAGDIILSEAGGYMFKENKTRLSYNKENLRNPNFLCFANSYLVDQYFK